MKCKVVRLNDSIRAPPFKPPRWPIIFHRLAWQITGGCRRLNRELWATTLWGRVYVAVIKVLDTYIFHGSAQAGMTRSTHLQARVEPATGDFDFVRTWLWMVRGCVFLIKTQVKYLIGVLSFRHFTMKYQTRNKKNLNLKDGLFLL